MEALKHAWFVEDPFSRGVDSHPIVYLNITVHQEPWLAIIYLVKSNGEAGGSLYAKRPRTWSSLLVT